VDAVALRALLASHAPVAPAPFVPTLRVHQVVDLVALWGALDDLLGAGPGGSPPPFWAVPWVGGQVLAHHLLSHPALVAGRRVLDFAAGSGLAGLAAAHAGAAAVEATELDPVAVVAMGQNARENNAPLAASVRDVVGEIGPWDVILAGDVCYERGAARRIFAWLRALAGERLVLLADPGRAFRPSDGLVPLATHRVPTLAAVDGERARETTIYRVEPASRPRS
jgi:predicted nicotinamide N-methyase